MRTFDSISGDELAARFAAELESALLAQALAATCDLPDDQTKALLGRWLLGSFNGAAMAIPTIAEGTLGWEPDGDGFRFVWQTRSGIACPMARLYQQPNGTWAALIVAGVRDDLIEAMAAAEWGVSRLTA